MTEIKPSTMLRYFTNENGKHYSAVVLKNNKILSVKIAGEKDKTMYDSIIHWLASLPCSANGSVTISDIDIKERESSPKPPSTRLLKKDTITLKDIAPTYDLLRFLLTYEAYTLKDSLVSLKDTYKIETRTYVKDLEGNLHPVKYNRYLQKLYSEFHDKFGTTLEEIGFPHNADIYVKVPGLYYDNRRYRELSFDKAKFPFTSENYESFYDSKFAFVVTPTLRYNWNDADNNVYHHKLITDYLKMRGYHIYTQFFRSPHSSSIFNSSKYKYLEGNLVVVQPIFDEVIVHNYNPIGFVKIALNAYDNNIIEELKYILVN